MRREGRAAGPATKTHPGEQRGAAGAGCHPGWAFSPRTAGLGPRAARPRAGHRAARQPAHTSSVTNVTVTLSWVTSFQNGLHGVCDPTWKLFVKGEGGEGP